MRPCLARSKEAKRQYYCLFGKRDTLSRFASWLMVRLQILWPCGAHRLSSSPGELDFPVRGLNRILVLQSLAPFVCFCPIHRQYLGSVSLVPAQIAALDRQTSPVVEETRPRNQHALYSFGQDHTTVPPRPSLTTTFSLFPPPPPPDPPPAFYFFFAGAVGEDGGVRPVRHRRNRSWRQDHRCGCQGVRARCYHCGEKERHSHRHACLGGVSFGAEFVGSRLALFVKGPPSREIKCTRRQNREGVDPTP